LKGAWRNCQAPFLVSQAARIAMDAIFWFFILYDEVLVKFKTRIA
jgi:hypothetical protein